MHFNIADLNSPALLFVGREEFGRERLTISPIGRIVTLAVRVTRPPNTPVSTYFASALSTVRAKVGPESKIQCPPREHIPFKENIPSLKTRARERYRSHAPVPLWKILPDPESRDNPAITSQNRHPQGKWVLSPRVPLPREIITRGAISQVSVPPSHIPVQPILGVLKNLYGKITPTDLQVWQPQMKQPTNYLPSIFITITFRYWNTRNLNTERENRAVDTFVIFYFTNFLFKFFKNN